MKLIPLVFVVLIVALFAAAETSDIKVEGSCSNCREIDIVWNEIIVYLKVSSSGGIFFDPILQKWVTESKYLTSSVPTSFSVSAPKCSASGGECIDISKNSCPRFPDPSAQDCPPPNDFCCPRAAVTEDPMLGRLG